MELKLRNNLKPELIRRILIGVVIGLLLVGIWSLFLADDGTVYTADMQFDSEVLPLPGSETADHGDTNNPTPPPSSEASERTVNNNENDRFYPHFSTFRAHLNSEQAAAITKGQPVLSIIVSGVGLNRAMNDIIIEKLSNNITLALSPYLKNHNEVASRFNEYGFEVWMDLAAITYEMNRDGGDLALNPVNNFENNIAMVTAQLNNKDKVTGVVLPPQALIIETPALWSDIVSDLFSEGYGIVDNTAQVMKPSLFFYNDRRAPYIKGDQHLSNTMTTEELKATLAQLRKTVKEQGGIIATIPVTSPAALDILTVWVNSLGSEGITLVPVSAQAKL